MWTFLCSPCATPTLSVSFSSGGVGGAQTPVTLMLSRVRRVREGQKEVGMRNERRQGRFLYPEGANDPSPSHPSRTLLSPLHPAPLSRLHTPPSTLMRPLSAPPQGRRRMAGAPQPPGPTPPPASSGRPLCQDPGRCGP